MRIYAAQGNRAAIFLQFEACTKALKEISAEPSDQTRALFLTLTQ
jgi:hypothetical protein